MVVLKIICLTHNNKYWLIASQVALVVKNLPARVGDIRDAGSIPGSGRCPLQYSYLKNAMNRGVWLGTADRAAKS